MYELMAQIAKFIFIILIYYFLYNFLKVMVFDMKMERYANKDTGYYLLSDDGNKYPLQKINTIGRASDSDIIIDDPYLSSKHALISKRGPKMIIQDLNSTNGTFLNGKKVKKPMHLREKDEVVLGIKRFVFLRRGFSGTRNEGNL